MLAATNMFMCVSIVTKEPRPAKWERSPNMAEHMEKRWLRSAKHPQQEDVMVKVRQQPVETKRKTQDY